MRVGLVVAAGIGTLLVTGGGIAIGRYIVPSSPGSIVAASTTTTASPSDAGACEVINSDFYYPTIPATGEHVSFQQAVHVEALLKEASASGLTLGSPQSSSGECSAADRILSNLGLRRETIPSS